MRHLLQDWDAGPYQRLTSRELFGHPLISQDLRLGVYLGHLRDEYPGTDALSLSVAPQALIWLETLQDNVSWVFGEGTRLGHQSFLEALHARTELTIGYLTVSPEEALRRREARAGKLLSEQYCKIATSKAANIAAWCRTAGLRLVELDGTRGVEELEKDLDLTP